MLPIIVAGSRPAATVLVQRRHFDCDTSVDLHRLLHPSIAETPRSRVSLASTVLLNPIGSHRLTHAQQTNRHRARGTASHIPSRDFLLWRFSNAGPSRSVRGAVRHRPASENLHNTGSERTHSITSSARASSEGGTVRPRALAVLRLRTNSNFVGWMTGRSAGFSPLRIRAV